MPSPTTGTTAPLSDRLRDWYAAGQFVRHGGHALFYRVAGSGEPLLLIHGFPTASWGWHRVWDELAATRFVIALDLLGSGFSDKPPGGQYGTAGLADQCETVLAHLGVREVDVLAHAYGVSPAQELLARDNEHADQRPFRLRSVSFVNGALFPADAELTWMQRLMIGPLGPSIANWAPQPYPLFRRSLARAFGRRTAPTAHDLSDYWALLCFNDGHRVTPQVMHYLRDRYRVRERLVGALRSARVPLQLVHSPDDPIVGPGALALWREQVPDGRVDELPAGVGHYPPLESPRALLDAWQVFDRERRARPRGRQPSPAHG